MSQHRSTRRRFLALSSAAGITGIAGCADRLNSVTDRSDDDDETNAGNESDSETDADIDDGAGPAAP